MIAAEGILTARGGVSSHAALLPVKLARCVCGAAELEIDYHARTVKVGKKTFKEGDFMSINGTTGEVFGGELKTAPSEIIQVLIDKKLNPKKSRDYQNSPSWWAGEQATKMNFEPMRILHLRLPMQLRSEPVVSVFAEQAMFFEGNRIDAMRQMILRMTKKPSCCLKKLLPYQRKDFTGIFKALEGRPATIRLLDPPLHEFLPMIRVATGPC